MLLNFDIEKCVKAKKLLNKSSYIRQVWKVNFSSSASIGNCTNLYNKLQPTDYNDFFKKYFEFAEKNNSLPVSERGLTESEFIEMAILYKKLIERCFPETTFPLETYLNACLCHTLIETIVGKINENKLKKYLETKGCQCEDFDGAIDAKYSVDIKVTTNKNKQFAIQVKPITMFLSKYQDTIADKNKMIDRNQETLNDLGLETYYAIYEEDELTRETKWLKNGEKFLFKLKDMLDENGNFKDGQFFKDLEKEVLETDIL